MINLGILWEIRYTAGRPAKLKNVHARIRAINDINISTLVHFGIVGLDSSLTPLVRARTNATFIGLVRYCRDVITHFFWLQRITHIESSHARIEVGNEDNAAIVNR